MCVCLTLCLIFSYPSTPHPPHYCQPRLCLIGCDGSLSSSWWAGPHIQCQRVIGCLDYLMLWTRSRSAKSSWDVLRYDQCCHRVAPCFTDSVCVWSLHQCVCVCVSSLVCRHTSGLFAVGTIEKWSLIHVAHFKVHVLHVVVDVSCHCHCAHWQCCGVFSHGVFAVWVCVVVSLSESSTVIGVSAALCFSGTFNFNSIQLFSFLQGQIEDIWHIFSSNERVMNWIKYIFLYMSHFWSVKVDHCLQFQEEKDVKKGSFVFFYLLDKFCTSTCR